MSSFAGFTIKEGGKTVHLFPSNFFIEPDGTCVESEFQAEKFRYINYWLFIRIRKLPPGQAKKVGNKNRLTPRQIKIWDARKVKVMKYLVKKKFLDHPDLSEQLIATGDAEFIELNWWHDQFWGSCTCRDHHYRIGKNWLGKILMEVREELNESQ